MLQQLIRLSEYWTEILSCDIYQLSGIPGQIKDNFSRHIVVGTILANIDTTHYIAHLDCSKKIAD